MSSFFLKLFSCETFSFFFVLLSVFLPSSWTQQSWTRRGDVPGQNKPNPNSLSVTTQDYWFQITGWFCTDNQQCVVTVMDYQGSRSQLFCYDSYPLAMVIT